MTSVAERTLPQNLEAERSVLGAILIDHEVYPIAAGVVTAPQFFRDAHRLVFKAMTTLHEQQQPIELVTLKEELARIGKLEEVGGASYIATLVDGVPRATNVEYYARIVHEKAKLRDLIFTANRLLADAYEAEVLADEVIDRAEQMVMAIGRATVKSEFVLADDWAQEMMRSIDHAVQMRRVVTGVSTSIPKLDHFTRGLQPSDLIYIGARPSVGKTALMLQMALHAADEVMVGVVSLEMTRGVIGFRAVAMEARLDLFRVMTGYLSASEQLAAAQALERIGAKRLAIDDASGITGTQLRAKVRRLAAKYGLGIVFVDYLQLVQSAQRGENRNLELAAISASLKTLAKDLEIPVVVLSQLSRDSAKTNRRPMLSDLRDSGSLEQDADVVLLLHRSGQHDDSQRYSDGEEAELIIAKQRNGPTGTVKLRWLGEQVRFGELEPQAQPELL